MKYIKYTTLTVFIKQTKSTINCDFNFSKDHITLKDTGTEGAMETCKKLVLMSN